MRRAAVSLVALLLGACVLTDPTPRPSPATASPEPTASSSQSAEPTPPPSVESTAGPGDVPRFAVGAPVTTNAPGLRVRSRPGTEQRVITSLGFDADLIIGLGPVFIDELGWYLVRDADPDEPAFGEGWVAAGFEPDPYLIGAGFAPGDHPYLAGYAHDASGEFGPVIWPPDEEVSVRWIAAALDADGCSFAVDLRAGAGDPVPAIRTTVGSHPAPGELLSQFFAPHPELAGEIFVLVTSDCSWALTFVRAPEPPPSPAPSG